MDNNEATNGHNPSPLKMTPMEIETESASLAYEMGDFSSVVSKLTLRKKRKPLEDERATIFSGVRGLLRTKTAFAVRNAMILAALGWLMLLFVGQLNRQVEALEHELDDPRGIHQSSFGGMHNTGQPAGARARQKHEGDFHSTLVLPIGTTNVGQRVPSISMENLLNEQGHYWHDPFQSPFASHLYALNDTVLDAAQQAFEEKMAAINETYGAWDLVDPYFEEHNAFRPKIDATGFKNGDVPVDSFPPDSWQTDEEYVNSFIQQARKLIHRVKEGIYAEYGMPSTRLDGSKLSNDELRERDSYFQVILDNFATNPDREAIDIKTREKFKGIAYLHRNAWDGLVTKLLHGLITNDDIYVVQAGDGAAAGHGNNFLQSSIMSFHYLMEPVFNILGMRLISRNMAMRGASTTFSALGGADIYGEADILWYASEATESDGQLDLFLKQAILSGERVPLLLGPYPRHLVADSQGRAWQGNLQPGHDMCDAAEDKVGVAAACKWVACKGDRMTSTQCKKNAYESTCWVNRKDYAPRILQDATVKPTTGYPGYQTHQLEGRKLSFLFLHALEKALEVWVGGIKSGGFPLDEKYWHVSDLYETIRESVRTDVGDDGEKRTPCESLFPSFPMVCHVAMHAYTDWTPRVTPRKIGLKTILHPNMDVKGIYTYAEEAYEGIDILPLNWKLPSDQVDVHAIAIATAAPSPDDAYDGSLYDDDGTAWTNEDDDSYDGDTDWTNEGNWRLLNQNNRSLQESAAQTRKSHRRLNSGLSSSGVPAGKGWTVFNPVVGFCDGSAQSTCDRTLDSRCLMAGHNDHQSGLLGDGFSGWLKLRIPGVKEGIILARMDTTVKPGINERTNGWTSVDQGNSTRDRHISSNEDSGELSTPLDFAFDYAINGKIVSMSRTELHELGGEIAPGLTVYPFLLDASMAEKERDESDLGETIDLAIRVRSSKGRDATIVLSHIYYS